MGYGFSEKIFSISALLSALKDPAGEWNRLVLFGAGGWGEALLSEIGNHTDLPVVFTDNDSTKHGLLLQGKPIVHPGTLNPLSDIVAITTLSAGDKVSAQLEAIGFKRNVNYFEVMENRDEAFPFHVADFYLRELTDLKGKEILHVGPGGKLGVEIILAALGASRVVSIEYNSFGITWPDVSDSRDYYTALAREVRARYGIDVFSSGILLEKDGKLLINQDRIRLVYPCSVAHIPFEDNSFDYVLHHAVFEHVSDPLNGYREIYRVLKKGGRTIGLVDPQDHRGFSSLTSFHPLKFLEYPRQEWLKIAEKINFHNQVTAPEHHRHLLDAGFVIQKWNELNHMTLTRQIMDRFDPMFQGFDPFELGVLRFEVTALREA